MTEKKDIQKLRERRSRSVKAEPTDEDHEKNEHESKHLLSIVRDNTNVDQ